MVKDIRFALRQLLKQPAFTTIAVVTVALAIGATTAVFSIVDGVLLKPLAYPESERLVGLKEIWRQLADRIPTLEVNEQHFEYWRRHSKTFESMAQYIVLPANLTGAASGAQSLSIELSNSNPSRTAMIAMPCRPRSPPTITASPGRTDEGRMSSPCSIVPTPAVLTKTPSPLPRSTTFVSPVTITTPAASAASFG